MIQVPRGESRLAVVHFGPYRAGLSTVGYTLRNGDGTTAQPRTTVGVRPLGQGDYSVEVSSVVAPADGFIEWDTGSGDPSGRPTYAREEVGVVENVAPALDRLSGGPLAIVSPLSRTAELALIPGDDYMASDGRAIIVRQVQGDTWPADLTGWTLGWLAEDLKGGRPKITGGTCTLLPGPSQAVQMELPASVTAQFERKDTAYAWALEATRISPARRVTLRNGRVVLGLAP